jgi:hypothetical protein
VKKSPPPSAAPLEKALARVRGPLTVADAAAKAGLPLRDAEEGLRWLAAEFRGHMAATEKGELLYEFPRGLTRPPETRALWKAGAALKRGILGVGRFVVRAWVSVVVVTYAVGFAALMIAMATRGNDRDDGPGEALAVVLRVIAEALFWTFHPFSPVWVGGYGQPAFAGRRRAQGPRIPFYEKVNRFVFGPPPPARDAREEERRVLAEIRQQKGRVTVGDVQRVLGLEREAAERVLLRLMVDYDGEVEVADNSALVYRFSGLRTTVIAENKEKAVAPVWDTRVALEPLTGNTGGANVMFGAINGFNLAVSGWALANGLTLDRLQLIWANAHERFPQPLPPADGTPLLLGVIPFVFSAGLFALPLVRAIRRGAHKNRVARENGWRGLLRLVLAGRGGKVDLSRADIAKAWVAAGGNQPTEREIDKAVREAGGETTLNEEGKVVYRFADVEAERVAAEAGRSAAAAGEASPGAVVFSSADEGPGMREPGVASGSSSSEVGKPAGLPEGNGAPKALPERKESLDEIFDRLGVDTRSRRR